MMFSIDECISGSPQSIINLDVSTNDIAQAKEGYHMVLVKVSVSISLLPTMYEVNVSIVMCMWLCVPFLILFDRQQLY